MVRQIALEMGISIVFSCLVVQVVFSEWCKIFYPLRDVMEETSLRIIYVNARSNMHRAYKAQSVLHARALQRFLDMRSDVDQGIAFRNLDLVMFSVVNVCAFFDMGGDLVTPIAGTAPWIKQPVRGFESHCVGVSHHFLSQTRA